MSMKILALLFCLLLCEESLAQSAEVSVPASTPAVVAAPAGMAQTPVPYPADAAKIPEDMEKDRKKGPRDAITRQPVADPKNPANFTKKEEKTFSGAHRLDFNHLPTVADSRVVSNFAAFFVRFCISVFL